MEVSRFEEKLNKVDGNVYVLEEKVFLIDGVYNGELKHDNINQTTLAVYTGPRLTGDRIQTYTLSTPSLTPWKRRIKVFASVPEVYITYETDGDTVEAEDVNRLQEAVSKTQTAVNTEYERATKAEEAQREELDAETRRAQEAEAELGEQVDGERVRAEGAERVLTNNLLSETARAEAAETGLKNTIDANKPKWDDKYTRNEVDNKFSTLETNIDWKESVGTFSDIAGAYPSPADGWTVNVKDTDYTYRWSGTAWVAISANSIPLSTQSVDGKMSATDKKKLDDVAVGAEVNVQPDWSTTDAASDTFIKNKPATFPPSAHTHSKTEVGLGDVENKSGADIRGELTKAEVVNALGYTPPESSFPYTHPDSGARAGTYRSVTINAQGHVTGGTNPTTLAEYGITDAMQKGPFTWAQMRGAYTWNQLEGV